MNTIEINYNYVNKNKQMYMGITKEVMIDY